MTNPETPAPTTERQAKQLFSDLRVAFTPLSRIYEPLHVGYVDSGTLTKLKFYTTKPQPIYLLHQGIWHAAVKGLGHLGELADEEMPFFLDPFTATQNLLASVKRNLDSIEQFLEQVTKQPNAAHILGRCLREPSTRTVWMVLSNQGGFPSEQQINESLDISIGGKV